MIDRSFHLRELARLLGGHRVVAILGARQVGKTTIARAFAASRRGPSHFFDLEDPGDLARLEEPMLALGDLRGLVVLDEVQRRPEIFPALRVLADRPRGARFLLLGSASPSLLRQTSESLAGRIVFHSLGGLSLDEVGPAAARRLWHRGGFPRSFTARSNRESADWRRAFIQTFLERDLAQMGISLALPAPALRRFWTMLAHYHGQILNSSELGRAFGVADTTVRHYLDLLCGTFMARQLPPWHENLAKRQVKSPKIYVADSGLLHTLLDIDSGEQLERHPKIGASWEGFCLEALVHHLGAREGECFFWATHGGAELDLLVMRGRVRRAFEMKRTDAPRITPSMRTALADLHLDSLDVIHAGEHTFPLAPRIRAVALGRLLDDVPPLG
ncbi:MAG: ATP-binding protein [Myxococcales bacterium]|nr:ATP-binding protein [Myxococcales bacterium]